MTGRPFTALDRLLFADDFDLAVSGGCPACGLEAGWVCVACGSCNCDTHENCVRPASEESPA
jgi:hypothetical protein